MKDGYYIYWDGNTAIIWEGKRYSLIGLADMLLKAGFTREDISKWLTQAKVKATDAEWHQIQQLPRQINYLI